MENALGENQELAMQLEIDIANLEPKVKATKDALDELESQFSLKKIDNEALLLMVRDIGAV